MAYINLTLQEDEILTDGKIISFKAPCDCATPDGIKIGDTIFTIVDSMQRELISVGGYFCTGAIVSVLLDTTGNKAYLINGAQIQADMQQTDPDAPDYVKNKQPITYGLESDGYPEDPVEGQIHIFY